MVIKMKIVASLIFVVAGSTQAQSLPDPGLATPALITPITTYTQPEISHATTTYYQPAPTVTYYQPAPTVTYYQPAPTVTYLVQQPVTQYYYQPPVRYYQPTVQYYRSQMVAHGSFLRRR